MEIRLTTFLGNKLRIDLEILTTPSGKVVTNLRPSGPMVTSEREAMGEAMAAAHGAGGEFVVLDTSETEQVDHTGIGVILLLNGRVRQTKRHFSLVVREGPVFHYLNKYGVLKIVRARDFHGWSGVASLDADFQY